MAEVDEDALPEDVKLIDCLPDLQNLLDHYVQRGRNDGHAGNGLVDYIYENFGAAQKIDAPVETWIRDKLPRANKTKPGKSYLAPQALTKYHKVSSGRLAPIILCGGVKMGGDKIGHFFQLGYRIYYRKMGMNPLFSREVLEDHGVAARKAYNENSFFSIPDIAEQGAYRLLERKAGLSAPPKFSQADWNHQKEMNTFGIDSSGVYSPADILANDAGALFYAELASSKIGTPDLGKYIKKSWNESVTLSKYKPEIGTQVWENILTVRNWSVKLTGISGKTELIGDCSFQKAGNAFTATVKRGGQEIGQMTLTMKTREESGLTVGAVLSGSWKNGEKAGQLNTTSKRECEFEGSWGNGQSDKDGGKVLFLC